jgi:hypothetical protein
MKNSTIANVAQVQLGFTASGGPGAPIMATITNPGNRIIQINIDRAQSITYCYFRIRQRGRVIFPVDTANSAEPGNRGYFVVTGLTQMFVDIPIDPDNPLIVEGFNSGAGTAVLLVSILTAGESRESLLLKILEQLETMTVKEVESDVSNKQE